MTLTKNAIIFIDGNNLYHNLKASFIRPGSIDLNKLVTVVATHFSCTVQKVIYYNSIPSIKDGSEIYYSHMKFLDEIKKYQGFEIKTRKLQRQSTREKMKTIEEEIFTQKLCAVCEPVVLSHWKDYIGKINVKEKGIDILIAVDIFASCLLRKECDMCVLVTGDADFIPCMDIVKSKGMSIATASTAKGYSYELRKEHSIIS